jgi:hypothetical protein
MRIRFRLSALLIATMIIAVCLGVTMTAMRRANEQQMFCELVRAHGGDVTFRFYAVDVGGGEVAWAGDESSEGFIARRLIRHFGAERWGTVTTLTLGPQTDDIATREILSLASHRPSIQVVAFNGQTVSQDVIERLNQLPGIRQIVLRRCALKESDLSTLEAPSLHRLMIREIDTSEWTWTFLNQFSQLARVHVVEGAIDISQFATALRGRSLELLALIGTDLKGNVVPVFCLPCASIGLYDVPVTDEDLSAVTANAWLRRLALERTDVSDLAVDRLAGLSLQHLDLSYTAIGDAALLKIAQMSTLESLEVRGTRVTDSGVMQLANLKNLRSLSVSLGSGVTLGGLEQLQSLLPACQIQYVGQDGVMRWIGQDSGS